MSNAPEPASERGLAARAVAAAAGDPLLVVVLVALLALAGLLTAPFDWHIGDLPRHPVPVDAIPDTGENQQIVHAEWPGRSPQDVEDQLTYPLTVALSGVGGVKSVRSNSMFGFSTIFVIFDDDVPFDSARARLVEKLASLPPDALPADVEPSLGPEATALGQVFWYTLEGWSEPTDDAPARPVGGFDLHELRSIQDWQVRYALSAVPGVAEVASVGGYVREIQVDVDPDALNAHGATLEQVFAAVRDSSLDVGASTLELNRAEYVVRGLGFLRDPSDLERAVVRTVDGVPLQLRDVARVAYGPAPRRGVLDKAGAEAVGGVVVARFGDNPLEVLDRVHAAIDELAPSLPTTQLDDGTTARVRIVPFYDRSELIAETLGTLEDALRAQVLITVGVVALMLARLGAAALVASLLPLSVLATFLAMKLLGVDANIVSLSGIAIAIGGIVDVGIVLVEGATRRAAGGATRAERARGLLEGLREVGPAVTTAVATTVVGFLPVFAMTGPEGKLFEPLAWTKTFALVASIGLGLSLVPALAVVALGGRREVGPLGRVLGIVVALVGLLLLAHEWQPAGPGRTLANVGLATVLLGVPLLFFLILERCYAVCLRWCLANRALFLSAPIALVLFGAGVWLGADRLLGWLPESARSSDIVQSASRSLPGLGREFMPPLDEGSFLLMPVTLPHASIGESLDLLQQQDRRVAAIPEVETVVGKIGRAESPLDPAPIAMVETVVNYVSEYRSDANGRPLTFRYDTKLLEFPRDANGDLIPDPEGRPFRQWRDEIRTPRDIWDAVAAAADVPGMTTASLLQPIETRRIMLQTGLRAPIGVKLFGQDLGDLEDAGLTVEQFLRTIPGVAPATVLADRIEGKPYLEIDLDRDALARFGLSVRDVQHVLETGIGGRPLTSTVDGRERLDVRVRLPRELRRTPDDLERILVPTPLGPDVPLGTLADLRFAPGPQLIRSEEASLVSHVTFAPEPGVSDVALAERVRQALDSARTTGTLTLPDGIRFRLAGNFENQVRAASTLRLVLPVALALIFLLLWRRFRRVSTTLFVFSSIAVAWAGGFTLLWLWSRPSFLDVTVLGTSLADLFSVGPVSLSVAVWVGFLALFGIASDDGVLMASSIDRRLTHGDTTDRESLHNAIIEAAGERIRPCLMTTATTTLALIPVLTSTGRGSDVMIPMALPTLGGMLAVLLTVFLVPVLYSLRERPCSGLS